MSIHGVVESVIKDEGTYIVVSIERDALQAASLLYAQPVTVAAIAHPLFDGPPGSSRVVFDGPTYSPDGTAGASHHIEIVKEHAVLPSGRIVVMVGEDPNTESLWFLPDGTNPKGSRLVLAREPGSAAPSAG